MKFEERARRYYTQVSVEENLADAGFTQEEISSFMELNACDKLENELQTLASHRKKLLDSVHEREKQISCLDYLVWRLKDEQV